MIERTLVLIKPDGVARGISGRIISRIEDTGMKIVGMKMVWVDEKFAESHYYDVKERHGEKIFEGLKNYMSMGPVIAMVVEGSSAIENMRKLAGVTESKSAVPGTIRGDFSHASYAAADNAGKSVINVIHCTANKKDLEVELPLWFKEEEMHSYTTVHEVHTIPR